MYKGCLGWMNGDLVPFDESYVEKVKNSPNLPIFKSKVKQVIDSGYSPPKDLLNREKFMKWTKTHLNDKTRKQIVEYLVSKSDQEKVEVLSEMKLGLKLPSEDYRELDKELKDALSISDTNKRLEKLYLHLYKLDIMGQSRSYLPLAQGREWPGDIISKKFRFLSGEAKDLTSKDPNDLIMNLVTYPGFKSYELELEMDTMELLSKATNGKHLEDDVLPIIRQKEEVFDDLFLYSNKHFDGSVDRTLVKLMSVSDVNPEVLVRGYKERINEREKLYYQSLEQVVDAFDKKENQKARFFETLNDVHRILYIDKYVAPKGLDILWEPNFVGKIHMETFDHVSNAIREIKPDLNENDLNTFEKVEKNLKSIINFDESLENDILSKEIEKIEKKIKIDNHD